MKTPIRIQHKIATRLELEAIHNVILSVLLLLLLFALPWIVSSISALIRCGNDVRLGNWVSMDNNEEEKAIADIDNAARTTGPFHSRD